MNDMMSDMKQAFWRRGFTLIELLVVISIIGILSGILYASFGDSRELARNNSMQAELKEVQLALELYKSQNGEYPAAGVGGGSCNDGSNLSVDKAHSLDCGVTDIIADLVPDFIAELPSHTDSGNANCDIVYSVDAVNQSWYKLTAEQCHAGANAASEGVQNGDSFARCAGSCPVNLGVSCDPSMVEYYTSYAVYSNGGECEW